MRVIQKDTFAPKPFLVAGGAFVFLVLFWWFYNRFSVNVGVNQWRLLSALGLGVAVSLFAIGLGDGWVKGSADKRGYRQAFLLTVAINFVIWVTIWIVTGQVYKLPLLVAILGALAGSLIITAWREGVWEDNFPPSPEVMADVYRRHCDYFGAPLPVPFEKRVFDSIVALLGLVLSMPLWLLIAFVIWFEDPGPVMFIKNSVGRGGKNFRQLKFRTMVYNAEKETGPVLAQEDDERVRWIGRFLRKTALDELPQLFNILIGDMSFVGPRPQRTVLVHDYLIDMPEYAERHKALPGISGLAQVCASYYISARRKLRYDRFYIRHASFGLDIKLLLTAFMIVLWFRWQKGWDGRLPHGWLGWGCISKRNAQPSLMG